MLIGYSLLTVAVIALIVAIYYGLGGRALFGTREIPQTIIGQTVELRECEWLASSNSNLPSATVTNYNAPDYRLDFTKPFVFDGREEHFVLVRCRHRGVQLF